ncbi:MAG: hypothetical protein KOO61_09405 [Spirochaetales bacterium]|nr:hypothetical protein [Spirochaetales bacterium]
MIRSMLQQSLLGLAAKLPVVQVQNRLMACTDRDFALALIGMESEDSERLLALVSPLKANRVREEIQLQEARHVESKHVVVALNSIIKSLESNRIVAGRRSYLRPRRPRSDR